MRAPSSLDGGSIMHGLLYVNIHINIYSTWHNVGTFYSEPADALNLLITDSFLSSALLPWLSRVLRRHQSLVDCLNCGLHFTYLLTGGHLGCFYLCVLGGVCVCGGQRTTLAVTSQAIWVGSRGQGPSLLWSSPSRLGWLARDPWRPACFNLPSTQITSAHHDAFT